VTASVYVNGIPATGSVAAAFETASIGLLTGDRHRIALAGHVSIA